MRRPPRHVAIPVTSTELRWIPGGVVCRENRLTLSPRHSPSRRSLVPNLPGGSETGGGSGEAGAHHAFLLTWTWQRRFKACPERPGTRGRRRPRGGLRGSIPRQPGDTVGSPAAPSPGARIPERVSPGQSPEARVGGSRSHTYLVPGAEAAAPGAGAAAAAGPRRCCPSAGSARSERVLALLRRPVGSPFSLAAAAVIPAA